MRGQTLRAALRLWTRETPRYCWQRSRGLCVPPETLKNFRRETEALPFKRIAVAMSGGVDSSVAALLLKRAGFSVFGIYMRNWDEEEEKGAYAGPTHCSSAQDLLDARQTCEALGIELHQVKFVREYWTEIFEPMLDGYLSGSTPNPDVDCNRKIKFKLLLRHALSLGADALATGHYARLLHTPSTVKLLQAVDLSKDQSYFLSSTPSSALRSAVFPLGSLTKTEVRELARAARLPTAEKRESMGLCFVGKRKFSRFIASYVPDGQGAGSFVSVDGQELGPHQGQHLYTIGQNARISGAKHKWFVAAKRGPHVIVAPSTDHPALFCSHILTGPPNWISGSPPDLHRPLQCRYRHLAPLRDCSLSSPSPADLARLFPSFLAAELQPSPAISSSSSSSSPSSSSSSSSSSHAPLVVTTSTPVRAVTPGQVLAIYSEEECLGSAPILAAGASLHETGGAHADLPATVQGPCVKE